MVKDLNEWETCNLMMINFAESINAILRFARGLPILFLIDFIRTMLQK